MKDFFELICFIIILALAVAAFSDKGLHVEINGKSYTFKIGEKK